MKTWITLCAAAPLVGLLCGCSEEAEAGTPESGELPIVEDLPVEGVSLDVAAPAAEPEPAAAKDDAPEVGVDSMGKPQGGMLGGIEVKGIDALGDGELKVEKGVTAIAWRDISLEGEAIEDILDKLLYPDQYEDDEFAFPERIKRYDGKRIAIVGYQIPLEWQETTVPEFMLVGDLLGCCFGGAPMPDQWINVKMKGRGAEYFPYIPVIVTGTLRIEGIEDEAGYAAGCYYIDADSVTKEF
jgi:hypothetical protein